ncbi:MAG: HAD hydrolase-like protein [Pirellulales bacterium]
MLTPKYPFLVGIDSDGCAFDTMELKHKECFIPPLIKHYALQGVSRFAREAAEFVNLYSKSRGCNRFHALIEQLDWLGRRPEVRRRGYQVAAPSGVLKWVRRMEAEKKGLANPTLEAAARESNDPDLVRALAWSKEVNENVAKIVEHVPPFPFVRECLEKLKTVADVLVVSATPGAALQKEWQEHDIARYVAAICGQEVGSKAEILASAIEQGKYAPGRTLMIGDAPGDRKAAEINSALFFPINPGSEEESWKRCFEEGLERFLDGNFSGSYQQSLIAEFEKRLPEKPPWPIE